MFICDRCGVVKEEAAEGVEDIMHTLAARMGFALRHNVIEAHGLCAAAWKSKPAARRDTASTTIPFSSKKAR
jgi:Fur family zinc uptake transcriptional regulator